MIETAPTVPADAAPDISYPLRHFELFEEIGRGGMGIVYKARQLNAASREVAVKTMLSGKARDPRFIRWFLRETRATLHFNHPNVVMAIEAGEFERMPYLAMELIDGPSLGQILDEQGSLPIPMACHVFAQAARGLRHAHQQGFLHRDVKPSNILLRQDGIAKVCDFGVAGFAGEDRPTVFEQTIPGGAGTPDYMAPEQAHGAGDLTAQVDLYSLGAALHHAIFGKAPVSSAASGFGRRGTMLPSRLAELGVGLLEENPENRPGSADEVIAALECHADADTLLEVVTECRGHQHGRSITLSDLPPLPKSPVSRKVFLGLLGGTLAIPGLYGLSRLGGDRAAGLTTFEDLGADQIEPNRKYPLFGRKPTLRWGNAADPHFSIDHDAGARTVKVNSLSRAVLRCGEIPFENFDLVVTVVQKSTAELGGFGVFFFGSSTGDTFSYDSLEVASVPGGAINLLHQRTHLQGVLPTVDYRSELLSDRLDPVAAPRPEFYFKIEARYGRLHRIILNGTPTLLDQEAGPPPGGGREFGIIVNGRAATFMDGQISTR